MKTIEELEIELLEIKKDKSNYVKTEMWEWCSKLRDRELQIIKEIAELNNKANLKI